MIRGTRKVLKGYVRVLGNWHKGDAISRDHAAYFARLLKPKPKRKGKTKCRNSPQ